MTKLIAIAMPILPGKTEQWKKFTNELKERRMNDYVESRKKIGVRERAFLQHTPQGDLVIVTLEGNDPESAFKKFLQQQDEFAKWFREQVKNIHGIDLSGELPPVPELLIDSEKATAAAGNRASQ